MLSANYLWLMIRLTIKYKNITMTIREKKHTIKRKHNTKTVENGIMSAFRRNQISSVNFDRLVVVLWREREYPNWKTESNFYTLFLLLIYRIFVSVEIFLCSHVCMNFITTSRLRPFAKTLNSWKLKILYPKIVK